MPAGVYFAASACVCAVCFVLYACILPTLPFVQYHRKKSRASLQPYRMDPVAPRTAVLHLDSRASSDSKQAGDAQLGDEEVSRGVVKHVVQTMQALAAAFAALVLLMQANVRGVHAVQCLGKSHSSLSYCAKPKCSFRCT